MGVSTDAILFYGFTFTDGEPSEDDYPWAEDYYESGWEEYYTERVTGIKRPDIDWDSYDTSHPDKWPDRERYDDWQAIVKKAVDECPCDIDAHCSDDYPMLYVAIKSSVVRAWRGYPKEIEADMGVGLRDVAWNKEIHKFCEIMGIEYEIPKWWLVSDWS